MKKEVQGKNNTKPLMECLEMIPEETLEELYEEALAVVRDKRPNKISEEEKKEYICGNLLAQYMASLLFFDKEELKALEELINGSRTKEISEKLVESNFVFEIDNEYIIPEELKEAFEHMNSKEIEKGKKNILITYYIISNGLLEVNKLIELVKDSGYNLTKKEVLEISKNNNYKVKNNIVYLNEMAEDLNKDNHLLELKHLSKYKVVELNEALSILMLMEVSKNSDEIEKFLKKKIKKKKELDSILRTIFNILLLNTDIEEMVGSLLKDYEIKLSSEEEEKFYNLLNEISHMLPAWTLNGYTPHEIYCDEDYDDEDDCCFEDLPDEDKKEIYTMNYIMINGIISIDTVVELLTNNHNLKTNKKEVIKIVKENDIDDEVYIIDNYLCYTKFSKEDFKWILSMKKLDKYKIIDDVDTLMEEIDENAYNFDLICDSYDLDEDIANELKSVIEIGLLNEETLSIILDKENYKMPLKKQISLYKELKPVIRNTRMWTLNGYTPNELNNVVKIEKVGRNELCPCGSGKKYKQCCGK